LAFATFSFGGYGLALAALALAVFGAIECPPFRSLIYQSGLTCRNVQHPGRVGSISANFFCFYKDGSKFWFKPENFILEEWFES